LFLLSAEVDFCLEMLPPYPPKDQKIFVVGKCLVLRLVSFRCLTLTPGPRTMCLSIRPRYRYRGTELPVYSGFCEAHVTLNILKVKKAPLVG